MRQSWKGLVGSICAGLLGCGGGDTTTDSPNPLPPSVTTSAYRLDDDSPKSFLRIAEDGLRAGMSVEGGNSRRCARRSIGPCAVVSCDNDANPSFRRIPDVGDLVVTGARVGAPGLRFLYRFEYYVTNGAATAPLLVEDPFVRAHAEGTAGLPPFEVSVARPEALALERPAIDLGYGSIPDRDLTIAWTPGATATTDTTWVQARFSPYSPGSVTSDQPAFECRWPTSAGTGTIPLEVLLGVGPNGIAGFVYVEAVTAALVTPADREPIVIEVVRSLGSSES